jgi:protein-tyrosine kinase
MISFQRNSAGREANSKSLEQHYSSLFHKLRRQCPESGVKVCVTSAVQGEGVSTVCSNLAVAAAQSTGQPTLLIDANLANSSSQATFGLNRNMGLVDILAGAATPECIQPTGVDGLSVVTAGTSARRKDTRISAEAFDVLLNGLGEEYANVFIDAPPPSESADCEVACSCVDGVVLVVEAENLRNQVVANTKQALLDGGANILGVVFNKRKYHVPNWLYRRL